MCKSKAEGGERCASHTRPAFRKAAATLRGFAPDDVPEDTGVSATELERMVETVRAASFDAFADHASTPGGRDEVTAFLREWDGPGLPDWQHSTMAAWGRSVLAEGEKRRAISKEVEVRLKGEQAPPRPPLPR